jgi:hypothetical protein
METNHMAMPVTLPTVGERAGIAASSRLPQPLQIRHHDPAADGKERQEHMKNPQPADDHPLHRRPKRIDRIVFRQVHNLVTETKRGSFTPPRENLRPMFYRPRRETKPVLPPAECGRVEATTGNSSLASFDVARLSRSRGARAYLFLGQSLKQVFDDRQINRVLKP